MKSATLALCLVLAGPSPSPAAPGEVQAPPVELEDFDALYQVKRAAITVGEIRSTLRYDASAGLFTYRAKGRTTGLGSLAGRRGFLETSRFSLADGRIVPREHSIREGKDPERGRVKSEIRFDWEQAVALATDKGEQTPLPLEEGMIDRQTLSLAVMLTLRAQGEPEAFTIIERDRIKTYNFTRLGEESVETPAGRFQAIKFRQHRDGSDRETIIWFAPRLGYLPVAYKSLEDGRTKGLFRLVEYDPRD